MSESMPNAVLLPSSTGSYIDHCETDYGEEEESTAKGGNPLSMKQAHKDITKWAGRLELESIDLRDKSSRLISELAQNSGILRRASQDMSTAIKTLKHIEKATRGNTTGIECGSKDMLETLIQLVSGLPGGQNGKVTGTAIQRAVKDLKSISSILEKQTSSFGSTQLTGSVPERNTRHSQKATMSSLDDKLDKCLKQLATITSKQASMTEDLGLLKNIQKRLASKVDDIKSLDTSQNVFLTPTSSYFGTQVESKLDNSGFSQTGQRKVTKRVAQTGFEVQRMHSQAKYSVPVIRSTAPTPGVIRSRKRQILPVTTSISGSCISLPSDNEIPEI